MLVAENIHKSYGKLAAVRGVSFELGAGRVVGLLGPNGAGKTTTIRIVTGYAPADAGRVCVEGLDVSRDSGAARARIGYLPESTPLYPEMTVSAFLQFRARLYPMDRAKRRGAVASVIERCWLTSVAGKRIGYLSKGYRQRVGLASAILHDPKVIVLDEPTNGLDPSQVGETRRLVRELAEGRVLLFSSHVLTEVERLCDRVIIISQGKVRADGTPTELVARAAIAPTLVIEAAPKLAGVGKDALPGVMRRLPGVKGVEVSTVDGSWIALRVTPEAGGPDLREGIARAIDRAGYLARRFEREVPSLEQTFASIIESASEAAA